MTSKTVSKSIENTKAAYSFGNKSIEGIIADLRVVIDQIGINQANARTLILELATRYDDNKLDKQSQICIKIKEVLKDKIEEGKITERWIEKCLPAKYKGKYTNNLLSLSLIEKTGNRRGIAWKLTDKGVFILKEILSRSVKNNTHNRNLHRSIPVRFHNITFSFRIHSMDNNTRLRWNPINNGVAKCFIKYPNHTLELTRSPYEGQSVLEVHLSEAYTFNPQQELIKQYDLARYYASLASQRLKLNISDNGRLTKKPHYAFERDLIALYLATFQTAEVTSVRGEGKTWIDSSKGFGELETNDPDYAYKYLTMPDNVMNINESVKGIARKLSGYVSCYDPLLTNNN